MPARLMDGHVVARAIRENVRARAAAFAERVGRQPTLATVLVGDDPASATYVGMKVRACAADGIRSVRIELPATTSAGELIERISELSDAADVDGILLQHPVPHQIDERVAFEAIGPAKDVDGVTLASFSAMAFGLPGFHSCTPGAIVRLLDAYDVELAGARVAVVGRSPILGLPVGMLLLARHATVTYCHSRTRALDEQVAAADIVIAAVGKPELIRGEWVKPGAVVIDAGYNAGNVGDVDAVGAAERARLITPVPGGVGPMTIAVLLEQTVTSAERREGGCAA